MPYRYFVDFCISRIGICVCVCLLRFAFTFFRWEGTTTIVSPRANPGRVQVALMGCRHMGAGRASGRGADREAIGVT